MSWDSYVQSLMQGGQVKDAVIVGCENGKESVWASYQGGTLGKITPEEVRKLVGSDRSSFFCNGLTLAGRKCTVLRDELFQEKSHTMDIRTKATPTEKDTFNIAASKSNLALVIVEGIKDIHGGIVNDKAFKMAQHLKDAQY